MITIASCARPIPMASAALLLLASAAHAVDVGPSAGSNANPAPGTDQDTNADRDYEPGGVVYINDLRLGYGFLPDKATISVLPKSGGFTLINYDKTTNWDKTGRTGLTWMTPWSDLDEDGGFLFGLELHTDHYVIEASQVNPSISYRAIALTIEPGIGWTLFDRSQLEITPFGGLGVSMTNYGSGLGTYVEIGIRAGLYYTFSNRWQVGLNASWMLSQGKMDLTHDGTKYDASFQTEGLAAALSLGYRFK
jgi:hypothetical protein